MKFRHLEYFVAAAEELNFTHAADRLHVSQPPFSKQIHDLEGELGINLFDRQRKGVVLTPAGKSFLIDARKLLEDRESAIRKAQRISRGEIGELAIGYMAALTHKFLGKALQVWRRTAPDIVLEERHSVAFVVNRPKAAGGPRRGQRGEPPFSAM